MSEQKQIIVEDVIEMLESGKTREEIKTHYDLNGVELKSLFNHPDLKGRRTHKKRSFVVVTRAETTAEVDESADTVEEQLSEGVDEGNDFQTSNVDGIVENSDDVEEAEVIEETTAEIDPHQDLHEEVAIDEEQAASFGQY